MAFKALELRYFPIKVIDANGFGIISSGEGNAVIPTIDRFNDVLAIHKVWSVTVVAGSYRLVTAMIPTVIYRLHSMAINACFWIFG